MTNVNASSLMKQLNRSFHTRLWINKYALKTAVTLAVLALGVMVQVWAWSVSLADLDRPSFTEAAVVMARIFGAIGTASIVPALACWAWYSEGIQFLRAPFKDVAMLRMIGMLPDHITSGLYRKLSDKSVLTNQDIAQFLTANKDKVIDESGFAAGDWRAKQFSALAGSRMSNPDQK